MNEQDDDVEVPAPDGTAEPGAAGLRMISGEEGGGEAACYAHLVCEECGSVTTEGHRAGCSRCVRPADG